MNANSSVILRALSHPFARFGGSGATVDSVKLYMRPQGASHACRKTAVAALTEWGRGFEGMRRFNRCRNNGQAGGIFRQRYI
jgi:hypothetical protein